MENVEIIILIPQTKDTPRLRIFLKSKIQEFHAEIIQLLENPDHRI